MAARRFFGPSLILGLGGVVALQGWIYLSVLDRTIGTRASSDVDAFGRPLRAALLRSDASSKATSVNPAFYFDLARQWEIALKEAGVPYSTITDADLAKGVPGGSTVLVLPSATCLGEPHRSAIRDHLVRGGGLVASGALGARNADCTWRGWDFLTTVTGLKEPFAAPPAQGMRVSFRGELFFSQGVPAGYSLALPQEELIAGTALSPDAYWSDSRLRPLAGTSPAAAATAVHGIRGAGRFAWFGFRETLHRASSEDRKLLDHYLASTVQWAGRQPLAIVGNWPDRRKAAVLVMADIQPGEHNAAAARLLRQQKTAATFFCSAAALEQRRFLLKDLASAGEIASAADSDDPGSERLSRARQELEGLTAHQIAGLYAPQGLWNANAVAALGTAGYRYYIDSGGARAVPELLHRKRSTFLPTREPPVARISQMVSDDLEVIANYQGPSPWGEDLAQGFLNDFQRVMELRGAYTLLFRSDLLGAPENLHILEYLIRKLRSEPVWMVSGERLVEWWLRRDAVRVEARRINPHRIRVSVTNRGPDALERANVYMYLPYRPNQIRSVGATLRRKPPEMALIDGDGVLRLDFPRLEPQSSQVFMLALDEE